MHYQIFSNAGRSEVIWEFVAEGVRFAQSADLEFFAEGCAFRAVNDGIWLAPKAPA